MSEADDARSPDPISTGEGANLDGNGSRHIDPAVLVPPVTVPSDAPATTPSPNGDAPVDKPGPAAATAPTGLGRGFWALCAAFGLAGLGTGITSVAFPWLTTTVTRDPLLVAGVGMMAELPWLLFSLPVGALIDRLEHRHVISSSHLLRALLLGLIAVAVFTDNISLVLLYAFAFLIGALGVANENATQTILPRVVHSSKLERANSNLELTDTTSSVFLGPMLGGVLVGLSLALPFMLDSLLFLAAAGLILLVSVPPRKLRQRTSEAERATLRTEIAEGVRYFWRHPVLRTLGIFLALLNLASGIAVATQVLFAQEILNLNAAQYGLLFSVGAVGAAIGAAMAPWLEKRLGARRVLLLTLFGSTVVTFAIGVASSAIFVSCALAVGASLAVCWNVLTISYRQRIVPEHMLGRVNSIYRLISWGPLPIGTLLGGVLVSVVAAQAGREIGLRSPLIVASMITLAMLLYAATRLRTGIWSRDPAEYRAAIGRQDPPTPAA